MKALTRGVLGFVGSLAAFAVAWDAAAQDYTTNFEDGGTGWTYQHLNTQTRWKVDNQPLIFISPEKKMDTMDDLSSIQKNELSGVALSPPASFSFVGPRFVSFWCYVYSLKGIMEVTSFDIPKQSRTVRVGPDPLTNPGFTWNFWLSTPAATWLDPFPVGTAVQIECPEAQWHQHIISTRSEGLPSGPGIIPTVITEEADKIEALFVLRVEFAFRHDLREFQASGGVGGVTNLYGVLVYWAIDNLRVSQFLQDPFAPEPHLNSPRGETGGSSEGCGTTSVELFRPPGGGPGPGGVLLLLAVSAVLWPLRLYLPRLRFERRPVT